MRTMFLQCELKSTTPDIFITMKIIEIYPKKHHMLFKSECGVEKYTQGRHRNTIIYFNGVCHNQQLHIGFYHHANTRGTHEILILA